MTVTTDVFAHNLQAEQSANQMREVEGLDGQGLAPLAGGVSAPLDGEATDGPSLPPPSASTLTTTSPETIPPTGRKSGSHPLPAVLRPNPVTHSRDSRLFKYLRVVVEDGQVDAESIINMTETFGYVSNVFGGELFVDYLGKWPLVTRKEVEASLPILAGGAPTPNTKRAALQQTAPPSTTTAIAPPTAPEAQAPTCGENKAGTKSKSSFPSSEPLKEKEYARIRKGWGKLSPAQKSMTWDEMKKEKKKQVAMLTPKLVERVRCYVEADLKRPGEKGDFAAFEDMMRREVDDLKMENFGVELLHTIGKAYTMKASSFLKSRKGLGIPGFFSRVCEQGTFMKSTWHNIGLMLRAARSVRNMWKLEGGLDEEELRALQRHVASKILLACWNADRSDIFFTLRKERVVDKVLSEPGQPDDVLCSRAKALLLVGDIFQRARREGIDEEGRDLERILAEAERKRREKSDDKP